MKKLTHCHHISLTKYIYKTANGDYVFTIIIICQITWCLSNFTISIYSSISIYVHIIPFICSSCRDAYPGTLFNAFGIRHIDTEAFIAEAIMATRDNLRNMKASSDFNKNALTKPGMLFIGMRFHLMWGGVKMLNNICVCIMFNKCEVFIWIFLINTF